MEGGRERRREGGRERKRERERGKEGRRREGGGREEEGEEGRSVQVCPLYRKYTHKSEAIRHANYQKDVNDLTGNI